MSCLFVLHHAATARAADLIWSGGGADEHSSNPVNWAGGVSPQHGDAVIFDSTSSKNCSWDLDITLSSFSINPGYDGTITIDAGLTVDHGFIWTGDGGDALASNPANWSGSSVPQNGADIDFDGMKDCMWDLDISPSSMKLDPEFTGNVTLMTGLFITGDLFIEGGILDLNDKALHVDGNLFIHFNGTLYAASSFVQVKGNWINNGVFASGTSTVILSGTNETVYGDNTFYNFVKTTDSADTLYFETGRTQTILNNLTLKGNAGNLLFLRSTVSETFWFIDPGSARIISSADIRDMNNVNQVGVTADASTNSGHNSHVYFDSDQCM